MLSSNAILPIKVLQFAIRWCRHSERKGNTGTAYWAESLKCEDYMNRETSFPAEADVFRTFAPGCFMFLYQKTHMNY